MRWVSTGRALRLTLRAKLRGQNPTHPLARVSRGIDFLFAGAHHHSLPTMRERLGYDWANVRVLLLRG